MMEDILKKILQMREGKSEFKKLEENIKNMDDIKFEYLINRLKTQIEIVNKYKPKVRPALDPVISFELGVYRRLDDYEIGKLLNYPLCCIKSFSEDFRIAIDREHLKEAKEINTYAIVITSGFIPCSLKCKMAMKNGLLGYMDEEEFKKY
ncbi:hypothetical protein J422_07052 [Methanocaldococcus villosus KIN24-T80]|uniref:DUF483 domain-containing protein n=1 Tax=Methanocaldococcus villosus KIN24-T80 TaxID=1069083 RepID=N6UZY1_9EURY|nr:DUF483 domain-containing protein [Methanocaldococcus villosus]ENN95583.1 hypothetical protein J422_07052 [Methanocaldococcus villosus KIN24-T80]